MIDSSPFSLINLELDWFIDDALVCRGAGRNYGVDLTIEYRIIRSRATSVWSLQLMNLTGYKDFNGHRINLRQNTIEEDREKILIPNLSYKIEF